MTNEKGYVTGPVGTGKHQRDDCRQGLSALLHALQRDAAAAGADCTALLELREEARLVTGLRATCSKPG